MRKREAASMGSHPHYTKVPSQSIELINPIYSLSIDVNTQFIRINAIK
jgi:hypothetical protein